ncbi:Cnl2/NKP2 family protein-domain-containing protein [Coniochaeta sp. 2T2.1]|nr:Cnl2/NKP2 family protein-domain-containing protein [Coniochaeta sp. 2T2.1]
MAPTESAILANFLLTPSQLPAIITPQEFTALFPRAQQSSTQIRTLYRDLQGQRNAVVDQVAAHIESEERRGKYLRQSVVMARRQAERDFYDKEETVERSLFGNASGIDAPKRRLQSVLPELESAIVDMEGEIRRLEEEEAELRKSLDQIVGSMSDLRYGRLANSQLPEQVLGSLSDLQETCKRRG